MKVLSIFMIYRIWNVTLIPFTIVAVCDGCHACGRQCLLNPEHPVVLSAGPISHGSLQW